MLDDSRVRVETVSASLTITQPRDIALYSRVFELLQRSAVHGREVRQLITRAIQDLTGEAGLAVNFCQHRCPTIPTLRSVELRSQPGRGSPGGATRTSQLGERDARRQDEHRR
jgi:hypothetical protein